MVTVRQIKAARALLGWSQDANWRPNPEFLNLRSLVWSSADGELGGRADTGGKIALHFRRQAFFSSMKMEEVPASD